MKHFRQLVVAKTVDEALHLRKEIGAKSLYLAGGTSVVPMASKSVEVLIDISRLGLSGITIEDGSVSIGATTKIGDLLTEAVRSAVPSLHEASRRCATPIIRNMATVGGSLVTVYLPSDVAVALAALDANLEIAGDEKRIVSIDDLLSQGWLQGHQLLKRVTLQKLKQHEGSSFHKFGRSGIDIALVDVGAKILIRDGTKIDDLRISVGQSLSMPVVLKGIADDVRGKDVTCEVIDEISEKVSKLARPRADFRASAQYRGHLIRVLTARAVFDAAREAGWGFEN